MLSLIAVKRGVLMLDIKNRARLRKGPPEAAKHDPNHWWWKAGNP